MAHLWIDKLGHISADINDCYIYIQCPVKVFVGLHEGRGQPRFETRSLYHFIFQGEGGVVHGKMASAHFMCVTLLGNPYANKQLIRFRFKKYQIFNYRVQSIVPYTILHKCLLYIWFRITLWKTCILLSPHRFHQCLKSSLVSEFFSLSETDILSCRFVANYMKFIKLALVSWFC